MATLFRLCILLTAVLVLVEFAVAVDPLAPAPAPQSGAEDVAPSPRRLSPTFSPPAPSPSPSFGSPPAPPASPESSPTPSPDWSSPPGSEITPSPAPSPAEVGDVEHSSTGDAEGQEVKSSSGGLKGGQKAGIAVGVIACVAVVGFGCLVYNKRQENIQRSRYGYAARRELL